MKKILVIMLLSLSFLIGFAQQSNVEPDGRLYARYDAEYLSFLKNNRPNELLYLNWYLDNAFVIKEMSVESASVFPKLRYLDKETKLPAGEVMDYDENFNIMEYFTEYAPDAKPAFAIGNTGKVLVLYSVDDLNVKFNNYLELYENR